MRSRLSRSSRRAGHQLGTIASYLLAPMLIKEYGWPSVFYIFGSLGFVWLLGWLPLVKNDPSELAQGQGSGAAAAAAMPAAAVAAEEPLGVGDVPWAEFLRTPAFWAIVAAQSTASVGSCLSFSWLPTFYNEGEPPLAQPATPRPAACCLPSHSPRPQSPLTFPKRVCGS